MSTRVDDLRELANLAEHSLGLFGIADALRDAADTIERLDNTLTMEREESSEVNGELKAWMSEACELLHEIRATFANYLAFPDDAVVALLRKAENP